MAVKIGIISDTHGLLRQEVVENLKDCRYILHAGDVTDPGILDQLRVMGELYAVQGNNDRSWQRPLAQSLWFEIEGVRFFMVHNKKDVAWDLKDRQVVIFGHSHKYFQEIIDGRLWLNPKVRQFPFWRRCDHGCNDCRKWKLSGGKNRDSHSCNLKGTEYNKKTQKVVADIRRVDVDKKESNVDKKKSDVNKKKADVKFIVGMVILVAVMAVMCGSFWKVVSMQAAKDKEDEARQEQEAIRAICVEAGDGLKEQVFVDMTTKTVFKADIPSEGIYNRNGKLVQGDVLENGDMVKIYGDSVMTRSIPAQYPGVTKMQRMGRATLEEAQPYQQIVDDLMA